MDKTKFMIVDPDERFSDLVGQFIRNYEEIEYLGAQHNGQDGLLHIRMSQPDVVLFDLVMPGMDGIALLRSVNELPNPPAMICCTRFYSDVALDAIRTFGAAYVIFKPVELHALYPAIISCAQIHKNLRNSMPCLSDLDENDNCSSAYIRNYIVSLGISSKLVGCTYLAEGVRLARMDISLTRNLSKGLYLEISRNMHSTPTRIERSIRNAISTAYQNGRLDSRMVTCPSNKEFINFVLRNIDS